MRGDRVNVTSEDLRAVVRAALRAVEPAIRAAVQAGLREATGGRVPEPEFKTDLSLPPHMRMISLAEADRRDHERRERDRARQIAVDVMWSQVHPPSIGPLGAPVELRCVSLLGVEVMLPCVPGSVRR